MPEKDLPAKLEKQNERVQALEDKIKSLEDREKDGKYLAELKKKLAVEKGEQQEIENIYSLSDMELEEIKAKAKALALVAYKTGDYEIYKNYECRYIGIEKLKNILFENKQTTRETNSSLDDTILVYEEFLSRNNYGG